MDIRYGVVNTEKPLKPKTRENFWAGELVKAIPCTIIDIFVDLFNTYLINLVLRIDLELYYFNRNFYAAITNNVRNIIIKVVPSTLI